MYGKLFSTHKNLKELTVHRTFIPITTYIYCDTPASEMCCMKGEKVSTPLDKDGRGPSGLQHIYG